MGKPFQLSLIADFRDAIKGSKDVSESLEQVASSMDDLARDTAQDSQKATDALESNFKSAVDTVKRETKSAGDKIGEDFKRGSREANEATGEMRESAHQNAREVAASFDGSAESIVQGFQGAAAEMFDGFGPAGVAAGLAAAAGLGILLSKLEADTEAANAAKHKVMDLAAALKDAGSDQSLLTLLENARDLLTQVNEVNALQKAFGDKAQSNFEKWDPLVKKYGLSWTDVTLAMAGNADALKAVDDQINKTLVPGMAKLQNSQFPDFGLQAQMSDLRDLKDSIDQSGNSALMALQVNQDLKDTGIDPLIDSQKKLADANNTSTTATNNLTDSTEKLTPAQQRAADAASTFKESLKENLSVADDGLDKFVKGGKLNLDEWTKTLREKARENALIKDFKVDIQAKLSPAALQSFEQLPVDTQAEIAKKYRESGKHDKTQIVTNLEAEVGNVTWKDGKPKIKVPKADASVTVDTKLNAPSKADIAAAAAEGNSQAADHVVHFDTTVSKDEAKNQTNDAANAAQNEANKASNAITLKTRIDKDDLQRQVDRAAASITPPTITVKTKVQKQVP